MSLLGLVHLCSDSPLATTTVSVVGVKSAQGQSQPPPRTRALRCRNHCRSQFAMADSNFWTKLFPYLWTRIRKPNKVSISKGPVLVHNKLQASNPIGSTWKSGKSNLVGAGLKLKYVPINWMLSTEYVQKKQSVEPKQGAFWISHRCECYFEAMHVHMIASMNLTVNSTGKTKGNIF